MCTPLACSDYYDGSAPSQPDRSTVDPAPSPPWTGGARAETVPVFTVIRSTKEEPDFAPAASPRLPRSTSPWPPCRDCEPRPGVPRPVMREQRRTAPGPDPPGSSRSVIKGRMTPVPRVLLSVTLTGPAPSGSASASRPCRGRLPPSPAPPGSGCPQLHHPCCVRDEGEGLSPALQSVRIGVEQD